MDFNVAAISASRDHKWIVCGTGQGESVWDAKIKAKAVEAVPVEGTKEVFALDSSRPTPPKRRCFAVCYRWRLIVNSYKQRILFHLSFVARTLCRYDLGCDLDGLVHHVLMEHERDFVHMTVGPSPSPAVHIVRTTASPARDGLPPPDFVHRMTGKQVRELWFLQIALVDVFNREMSAVQHCQCALERLLVSGRS